MGERADGSTGAGSERGDRHRTWLAAVEEVLDATIERDEAYECDLENVTVDVPLATGGGADRARWRFDGTVRVEVEGTRGPLAEWLRWWHDQYA